MAEIEEFRHIVRIAGKDINGNMPICRALTKIKGIGVRMGKIIAITFEKETQIPFDSKLGMLNESMDEKLEEIVLHPEKHGIPIYLLNRRRVFETGEDRHLIAADLDFALRAELQRMSEIKSYRGLRRSWGLTVRGQRTKSTHRGKGGIVGVTRKDVAQASAPKKAAEPAKKEKK